jgi:hypothetical protein
VVPPPILTVHERCHEPFSRRPVPLIARVPQRRLIRDEVSRAGPVAAGTVRGNRHPPWVLCQAILSINPELALLRQMLRLAARHWRVPMLDWRCSSAAPRRLLRDRSL